MLTQKHNCQYLAFSQEYGSACHVLLKGLFLNFKAISCVLLAFSIGHILQLSFI